MKKAFEQIKPCKKSLAYFVTVYFMIVLSLVLNFNLILTAL